MAKHPCLEIGEDKACLGFLPGDTCNEFTSMNFLRNMRIGQKNKRIFNIGLAYLCKAKQFVVLCSEITP